MLVNKLKMLAAFFACLFLSAGLISTARADFLFTTTGPSVPGGEAVSGSADFKIAGSTLEVFLTNTSTIVDIGQVLDGLAFTLIGGSVTGLTSVVPNWDGSGGGSKFEDCTGASCVGTNTFVSHQNGASACTDITSPFCWLFNAGLLAPKGYHPAGVVNSGISQLDGLSNNQHNDYLIGPVEFKFSFSGTPTGVSDVTFYWGTNPDTTPGTLTGCTHEPCVLQQVPEPGSLALLGLALSGLAWARRRAKS